MSETMQKCYNVSVTGKVQDVGLRGVVEYAGRLLDLSGLVFNAKNGSVSILCRGEDSVIRDFSQEIKTRGEQRGAVIDDIEKKELPFDIDLPYPFSRVLSDEDIDLGRKLDIGNDFLRNINSDTIDFKKDTSTLPDIKNILGSFVVEQREHNQHLEKILEKLTER